MPETECADVFKHEMTVKYFDTVYRLALARTKDKSLADELMKYAKYRLDHFMEFHKIFVSEAMKETENVSKTKVDECLWEVTHENLQDWKKDVEERIKKY